MTGPMPAFLVLALLATAQQNPPTPPLRLGTCVLQVDELEEPTGVAFGTDGSLYVAESLKRRVSVLDGSGKRVRTIGENVLLDPRDLALGGDGKLFVCDAGLGAVVVFTPTGELSRMIGKRGSKPGELLFPDGLDVSGTKLAVADTGNDRVQLFALTGEL